MGVTTPVLLLAGLGPAFAVVGGVAGLLLTASVGLVLVDLRATRRSSRAGPVALLGAGGVALHAGLAVGEPASVVGFLAGTAGASATVVAASRVLDSRPTALTAQALGVTGLVWLAGSVTVVGATAATDWPFAVGAAAGTAILAGVLYTSRSGPADLGSPVSLGGWLAVGAALLVPAAVGFAFGPEVLFVSYLAAVGVLVVCWWLVRAR
jgi:hypothetical protein